MVSAEEVGKASKLHQAMRKEVDEVLKSGLMRRLKALERKVQDACRNGAIQGSGAKIDVKAQPITPLSTKSPAAQSMTVQTGVDSRLSFAVAKALRDATRCAKPPPKAFGPTERQAELLDPPEKAEDVVLESVTMKSTLKTLDKHVASRERQILSLQEQLVTCHKLYEEQKQQADLISGNLRLVQGPNPDFQKVQEERIARREARVSMLTLNLEQTAQQAIRHHKLAKLQRAFILQHERVADSGGREVLNRHPAGEIALVLQPPPMDDEKLEVWDVGTAIANPYTVDSWPFEPNVLAKRAPQEPSMQPFAEETLEDILEEQRGFRNPFKGRGLNLRLPGRDDEDDRYPGQTETSRSL